MILCPICEDDILQADQPILINHKILRAQIKIMIILNADFYVVRLTLSEAFIFPQPNMGDLNLKNKQSGM